MTLPALPLVIFIIAVITVVLSVLYLDTVIRIPGTNIKYTVKFYIPPLVAVFILLILTPTQGSINGLQIWVGGFAGSGSVFPYKTMVQFETLAFVCISLDMTGVLAYIALKAIQAAGSSGKRLYFYFYVLASAFTICTSNDIVILTLTPIIYYCTKVAKISPYPMLFSEFFTANICSMVLVIGNPVNLIVANANGLGFAEYSSWMAAPAICGTIVCCFTMYFFYRKDIDVTIIPPKLNPEACIKDKRGIAFHGSVLFLTRLFLGVAGNLPGDAENWIITTTAALMSLMYNAYFWPWDKPVTTVKEAAESKGSALELTTFEKSTPEKAAYGKLSSSPSLAEKEFLNGESSTPTNGDAQVFNVEASAEKVSVSSSGLEETAAATLKQFDEQQPEEISVEEPTLKASILNCPWAVLPFVFGMFTLVNAMNDAGWIEAFAKAILDVIPGNEGNSPHAIAIATFLMTTISFCLCTLIDNQPASILLTQVLLAPAFAALPTYVRTAGMLGVLEGANVGGCWSLMGALAGIMWSTLLRNKGITIGYIQFMRVGLKIMPLATFVVALIIFFESWGKSRG